MSAFLVHSSQPLEAMAQSQALCPARLIFLISLVVFFTVLFVVSYVWMRRPSFGQHGGHAQPRVSRKTAAADGQLRHDPDAGSGDVV